MGDVEIPDWVKNKYKRVPAESRRTYAWDGIEVGTSLIVPMDEQTCGYRAFYVTAMNAAKKLNRKFHVRERDDGAFECWRER